MSDLANAMLQRSRTSCPEAHRGSKAALGSRAAATVRYGIVVIADHTQPGRRRRPRGPREHGTMSEIPVVPLNLLLRSQMAATSYRG